LKVAQDTIARRYPSFDPTGMKLIVTETAKFWKITYELPKDMLGGVPIITIDKRTCRVVSVQHSQ